MLDDVFVLFQYLNSVRIVRINSIFNKLSIEQLLEEFTQIGGASALSALFAAKVPKWEKWEKRESLILLACR
jgi:hypothetical protein